MTLINFASSMTDRELLEQALDAMAWATDMIPPKTDTGCDCLLCVAQDAIRARLRQPVKTYAGGKPNYVTPPDQPVFADGEREPVAWVFEVRWSQKPDKEWRFYSLHRTAASAQSAVARVADSDIDARAVPLYTTLPARHPLTADETMALANGTAGDHWCDEAHLQRFRAAIEKAHGIGGDA